MESLSQYSKDVREELKLSLQEVYNRTDIDVTLLGYKMFDLESRRYIGNKAKLTPWIMNIINEHTGGFESFFDVFAGTASVSKAAIPYAKRIIMNDFLSSNNIIYQAFFGSGTYDMNKLHSIIEYYNNINPDTIEDNYFDAYIKKNILYHPLSIQLIRPLDPQCVEIFREDSNILAENITADVAYIDPPYNSRQYSRFYHIYENLVTWEKPELFGVAMKPKAQNMSAYCTSSAPVAFRDLISKLNVKYIVVSYNNTYESKSGSSKNKITLEQIKSILEERGTTKIYDCDHRYFNAGKTNFAKHKELLFITEVGQ